MIQLLEIIQVIEVYQFVSGATGQGAIGFAKSGTTADGYLAYVHNGTATSSAMTLKSQGHIKFNAGSSTKVYIEHDGKVGIGTTNPSTELHVKDASSDCLVRVESESGYDARLQLDTSNGGGAVAHLDFLMDGTTKGGIEYVNNASSASVNCMIFRTTDLSERLRIDASGDITAAKSIVSANFTRQKLPDKWSDAD